MDWLQTYGDQTTFIVDTFYLAMSGGAHIKEESHISIEVPTY